MNSYTVEVTIQNKPLAQDPEGETIQKDLVNKGGFHTIKGIRSGKYLQLQVGAETATEARELVTKMCDELRIFNPIVHTCSIKVGGEAQ